MTCWIEKFVEEVGKLGYSRRFARMTAHSVIAAALGRRAYINLNNQALFMNLYAGMVAKPGSGKSKIMEYALQVIARANDFKNGTHIAVGNDSVSKASLVNDIVASKLEVGLSSNQPMITVHEMNCFHDELAVFMPSYEADKVGLLLKLYDCPTHYKETRVSAEPRELSNVYFNWLFGTQPDFWARIFAFEQEVGIKSRIVLCSEDVDIYSRDIFNSTGGDTQSAPDPKKDELVIRGGVIGMDEEDGILDLARDLSVIACQMPGMFRVEQTAILKLNDWWKAGGKPIPAHLAMGDYPTRRPLHVIKMAGHHAASRASRLIELIDVEYALSTLQDWEQSTAAMNVDLRQSEHGRVMDEAYGFLSAKTIKGATINSFTGQDLRKMLGTRVKVYEIEPIINQMVQQGYIYKASEAIGANGVKMETFRVNPGFKRK